MIYQRLVELTDRLFPESLAIARVSKEFRAYTIEFTTSQFRMALWLALLTFAAFGFWDIFGEGGGIQSTRFRYLVVCPIFLAFAAGAGLEIARAYRGAYMFAFTIAALALLFFQVVLIDREMPFKISYGNGALNYLLAAFFGYGLLPYLLFEGFVYGLCFVAANTILTLSFSNSGLLINSFYIFHTIMAMSIGMFVSYWREWFLRNAFLNQLRPSSVRTRSESLANPMKLLISYRRSDSDAIAGRIRDRLALQYGDSSIYMDIDTIPFGVDFRTHIMTALNEIDVLIAIIGTEWLGLDDEGHRRIDSQDDPIRMEIETALKRGISVFPVLVRGAKMPKPAELPPSIRELSFRNAAEVETGRDFHLHMERLIRNLEKALDASLRGSASPSPSSRPAKII